MIPPPLAVAARDAPRYPQKLLPKVAFSEGDGMLKQVQTGRISSEQLATEVKDIYAGLVMVENERNEANAKQATTDQESNTHVSKTSNGKR